jgi:hypothetical protein
MAGQSRPCARLARASPILGLRGERLVRQTSAGLTHTHPSPKRRPRTRPSRRKPIALCTHRPRLPPRHASGCQPYPNPNLNQAYRRVLPLPYLYLYPYPYPYPNLHPKQACHRARSRPRWRSRFVRSYRYPSLTRCRRGWPNDRMPHARARLRLLGQAWSWSYHGVNMGPRRTSNPRLKDLLKTTLTTSKA